MNNQKYHLRTNLADGAKLEETVVQISVADTHPSGRLNIPRWALMAFDGVTVL